MGIKRNKAYKALSTYVPSAKNPHIDAIEAAGLDKVLTAAQIAAVVRICQAAYQRGKADAGADKFGDAVWVNGVGMLFRMPDGRYNLTPIQSGGDK